MTSQRQSDKAGREEAEKRFPGTITIPRALLAEAYRGLKRHYEMPELRREIDALMKAPLPECGTNNAAPQAASTLAKVDVPESDREAKVSGEPAVAAPTSGAPKP